MKKLFIRILYLILILQPLTAVAEGLSTFGDLLVWQASQETSSTWASIINSPGSHTVDFNATNVAFKWNLGFRGGFVYEPECNTFNSRVYWTYFPSKANSNFTISDQIVIPEFFSGFLSQNIFFGANLDWNLIMNMFDYDISHNIKIGKSLIIRPSIGIKGGTINQTINATWNAAVYTATEQVKHNFSGAGPTFGIDCKWILCKQLRLFGDFATAFMWGNWKITDVYSRPYALGGLVTPTTITTTMNKTQLGTLMLKYCLGLEWTYTGRSIVTLQLGYEMQFWANQLRLPTFQQLPVHGYLTLQGGTCRIRIDL